MTIYLAGPISGHPEYKREFADAAERLEKRGHEVLNPATIPTNTTPENAMLICLPMLIQADAVFFLKGWEKSRGTRPEFALAVYLRKKIFYEENDYRDVPHTKPGQGGIFHPFRRLSATFLRRKVQRERKARGLPTDLRAVIVEYRKIAPKYADILERVLYPK